MRRMPGCQPFRLGIRLTLHPPATGGKLKSYADIKAQITRLEKEAELAREKELKEVIALIREKIAMYGLTSADLGLKDGKAKGKSAPKPLARAPKYRDPKTGKTWTGHGKPPGWIAGAKNRDIFLIEGAPSAPASSAKASATAKKAGPSKATTVKPARKVTAPKTAAVKSAPVKATKGKAAAKKAVVKKAAPAKAAAPAPAQAPADATPTS